MLQLTLAPETSSPKHLLDAQFLFGLQPVLNIASRLAPTCFPDEVSSNRNLLTGKGYEQLVLLVVETNGS